MIIASLTTYPKRLKRLKETLPFILNQTLIYDKLCIVIDDNLMENEINDLFNFIKYKKYENLRKEKKSAYQPSPSQIVVREIV